MNTEPITHPCPQHPQAMRCICLPHVTDHSAGITYPSLEAYLDAERQNERPAVPEKLSTSQVESLTVAGICPICFNARTRCEARGCGS